MAEMETLAEVVERMVASTERRSPKRDDFEWLDQEMKLLDVSEAAVIEAVGCTWCGVGAGQDCLRRDLAPAPEAPRARPTLARPLERRAWQCSPGRSSPRHVEGLMLDEATAAGLRIHGVDVAEAERRIGSWLASVLADDATVEVVVRAIWAETHDAPWEVANEPARGFWLSAVTEALAALSAHLAAPGPAGAGDTSGEEGL